MASGQLENAENLDPEDRARQKAERIEREKAQLLQDIAATTTNDLRSRVAHVLNHYPAGRDSDVTLAHLVWETFYPEYIDGDRVRLDNMYRLPRQTTITRIRAKIQNEYGLFQPSEEVAGLRRVLRDEAKEEMVADKPGPPVIAIHADESGKSQRYLVVGSVWISDIGKQWRVAEALREWKRANGIGYELKFAELNRDKLKQAVAFVKKALDHSDVMGLKACVLDTKGLKGKPEDVLYRLYYELAMVGIEHEIAVGRVLLPRWLSIVKDADDGPDALLLSELQRRLTVSCRDYFKDTVRVDSVLTARSDESPLMQLADLFSGSVARIMNKTGEAANQKDEFAAFFETVSGRGFTAIDNATTDFVYIHRLE